MTTAPSPKAVAEGAANRLCAYDAVNAPGDCAATTKRIAEFLAEFVAITSARLESAVKSNLSD